MAKGAEISMEDVTLGAIARSHNSYFINPVVWRTFKDLFLIEQCCPYTGKQGSTHGQDSLNPKDLQDH